MKTEIVSFAFCMFLFISQVEAQGTQDVVYLYNGSILKGKIIENVAGVRTSIEITGHNVLVFPDTAIKMVLTNQKIPSHEFGSMASKVEMDVAANFYGGSQNSGGFTFIPAYRFPFRLSAGVGTGIEWFDRQQIPFMADFRYCFLNGFWSPFVYAQGGYAIPLSKKDNGDVTENYGGILAGTGAGIRISFSQRNALFLSIGYRYQKNKTVTGSYPWYSTYPSSETTKYNEFNRITFAFGFVFN